MTLHRSFTSAALLAVLLSSCTPQRNDNGQDSMKTGNSGGTGSAAAAAPSVTQAPFGSVAGTPVTEFTIANGRGMTAKVITRGAAVTSLVVPDRDGVPGDVVLGFDDLAGYLRPDNPYFGCIAGRYANRIAGASFTLDGKRYELAANNDGNSLHGGMRGFDKQVWQGTPLAGNDGVRLTLHSPDGDEGYPGNLHVEVTYTLTPDSALKVEYSATTDRPTPVNLTHHGYFNLSAWRVSNILGHELTIAADRYTEVDSRLIPTGNLLPVRGTPMDFTTPHPIGTRIGAVPGGYDHNWVLSTAGTGSPAATLHDPLSGRVMQVFTTEPGLQFYAGNFLDGTLPGRGGTLYPKHAGLCLEAQHFPDSPNQPSFPNTILRPGENYRQTTIYKFSTR